MRFRLRTLLGVLCLSAVAMGTPLWLVWDVVEMVSPRLGLLAYLALTVSVLMSCLEEDRASPVVRGLAIGLAALAVMLPLALALAR